MTVFFGGTSMLRRYLFLALVCVLAAASGMAVSAQSSRSKSSASMWQQVSEDDIARRGERRLFPEKSLAYRLDLNRLESVLNSAPLEFTNEARNTTVQIQLPDPTGKLVSFRIEESPIMAPWIAAQHATWKTYQVYGIDDRTATGRLDLTDTGFHGYILSSSGTYVIDPFQLNDRSNYLVFAKDHAPAKNGYHCEVEELLNTKSRTDHRELVDFAPAFSHGDQIRTYRLAIGTTTQYTNIFRQAGDTNEQVQTRAFNQVVTTTNRVAAVYRKEVAVSFTLVSTTATVYVVEPETPANYSNSGSSDLNANVTNLNNAYGSGGYDVGHVFGSSDNGVAQLNSVCGSSKARGYSGQPNPVGDPFDVDYVAHEMGHQFGGNHPFNATANCNVSPTNARREPGSAVTVMGYAGICSGGANPQRNSIDIFHNYNQTEILNFLSGGGGTCGTLAGSNAIPVIAPLSNFTIPFNTPFELTASATDADGDPLTYGWEQSDPSVSTSSYPSSPDDDDNHLSFRPGFRSYLPVESGSRMFPSLTYVLNDDNEPPVFYTGVSAVGANCGNSPGGQCITGEDLPSSARTMNFKVTVRDGLGGVADGTVVLTVVNTSTPFKVTSNPSVWNSGETENITWDVSGTNAGSINTPNVKISLSTDGGFTFPHVLAASTPNDGVHPITVPVLDTNSARIKIEGVGNVFFDINDSNFEIVSGPSSSAPIGGRITTANGAGAKGVRVLLTWAGGTRRVVTNSFGYYRFDNVPYGATYTITPSPSKSHASFAPANIAHSHSSATFGLNFAAN